MIAAPGPPRMRIAPLVWNCPRCEVRRDLCIDVRGEARMDEESREVRELTAGQTDIQDTAYVAGYAQCSAIVGEKGRGVV